MEFGINSGAIGVYIGALALGIVYNSFVAWMHANGHGDGLVSLLVAGGVGLTLLLAIPLIGVTNTLLVAGLFMASGLPMIAGSIWRYINNLRDAIRDSADGH